MPPKKILPNSEHGYVGETKYKRKPPAPYIMGEWLANYIKERDRVLWQEHPYLREYLEEKHNGK